MRLTPQQCTFFDTFGYILLPGLMLDDVDWIIEEHPRVFEDKGVDHDGSKRTMIGAFISQRERLCTILDHPNVLGVLKSLLGDDFTFLGGDGNYYSGDTGWHPDGQHAASKFIKFHFYLDPLTPDTGCIRVIPGSHVMGEYRTRLGEMLPKCSETMGIHGRDVPCIAVDTKPGDIVVFNHNIYHASFGGGPRRRHFCLNVASRANTERDIEELDGYLRPRRGKDQDPTHRHPHALMRETAGADRLVHLQQVMERERYYETAS